MIKFLRWMGWILGILNIISGIISIVQAVDIALTSQYTQLGSLATSLIFAGCASILLGVFVIGLVTFVCNNHDKTEKHAKELSRIWYLIHELEKKNTKK